MTTLVSRGAMQGAVGRPFSTYCVPKARLLAVASSVPNELCAEARKLGEQTIVEPSLMISTMNKSSGSPAR
jgi:hypothetical protein